jgi:transcription elongation factor GreA
MASKPVFLSADGKKKLQEELHYLRTVRRTEVAAEIQSAKEEGDLSENSAYEEAKLAQGFLEGKIQTIEAKLREAIIIEEKDSDPDVVNLGDTVTIVELEDDGSETEFEDMYRIVGSTEADPANGRISNESPIGAALLGKRKGTVVTAETPGGKVRFKIIKIETGLN